MLALKLHSYDPILIYTRDKIKIGAITLPPGESSVRLAFNLSDNILLIRASVEKQFLANPDHWTSQDLNSFDLRMKE